MNKLLVIVALALVSASADGQELLGCFKDTAVRAMTGPMTAGVDMTNQLCVSRCKQGGYKYASTQATWYCFCSNDDSYDRYGAATNCDWNCAADASQKCGGGWANQVYRAGVATAKPTTTEKPTQKPTEKPTEKPTKKPTKKPTEKPDSKCEKQLAVFEESLLPVTPKFADGCKFAPKQCNADKCFCVKQTGKRAFGKLEVPLGQNYDCSKKPAKCFIKLFGILINESESGKGAKYVPKCTKRGQYDAQQCDTTGACWCVKKRGGKMIKNTKKQGPVEC